MAKVGIRYPVFAIGNYEGDTSVYTNGVVMGKAVKCDVTIEYSEAKLPADDANAESSKLMTGGQMTLELDDMEFAEQGTILGYTVDEDGNGVGQSDTDAPYGGHGHIRKRIKNGVTSYLAYWYYKVQFAQIDDSAATAREGTTDFQTMSLKGEMLKAAEGFRHIWSFATEAEAKAKLNSMAGISA